MVTNPGTSSRPEAPGQLERVMQPDCVAPWAAKPIAALGGRNPLKGVRARGREVSRVIAELENHATI